MKKLLKFISVLFFIMIILVCGAVFFLFHQNNQNIVTEEEVREVLSADQILSNPESGFSKLTPEEQATYLRICNEIDAINPEFYLTGNTVSEESFNKITNFILKDHPEYFYIGSVSYMKTPDGNVESVSIDYTGDPETIYNQQLAVEAWRDSILAGITPDMDNYQTAKYIHDYLVNNTTYNAQTPNNQNIMSIVESQSSVCAGYAKAYQYLLNQAGIFATYVNGAVNIGSHAWNLIQIDGEYGWVDPTWDDPSFVGNVVPEGYQSHTYFGISTEDLLKTHQFDTTYEAGSNYGQPGFNYFNREQLYFDLNDPNSYSGFVQRLREARMNGQNTIEVKVADRSQVDTLLNLLSYDPVLLEGSINYITDDVQPVISFILQ